jgi:hypothetical protein
MRTALPFALLAAVGLSACATTQRAAPTEVLRFHLGEPVERGTVAVEASPGGTVLGDAPFLDAVGRQLAATGYVPATGGGAVQFVATVEVRRRALEGPPRRSPVSIGIGGGGFSGGRRGGGVGLGGGVAFPVGGSGPTQLLATEMMVTIKRRADQSPIWEGRAQTVQGRGELDAAAADKLAAAMFQGFPGESGRTTTVR